LSKELDQSIVREILRQRPELRYEDIERLVKEKMSSLHMSSKTALYLVCMELGVKLESGVSDFIEINRLRSDLSRIRIIGRILWIKNEDYYESPVYGKRYYVRAGLGDRTGVANILFWGYTRDKLDEMGIMPGVIIDINGAYTKKSMSGLIEIHVGDRAVIKVDYEKDEEYPSVISYLTRVDQANFEDDYIHVYGKVLTSMMQRSFETKDRKGVVASFLLGAGDKAYRVTIWDASVKEYDWIKPGDVISIFNGRVKRGLRGEYEIHITRSSHIDFLPGQKIEVYYRKATLSELEPGYNLKTIYIRVLAKGREKINLSTGQKSLSIFGIDSTGEATIIFRDDDAVEKMVAVKPGDILKISNFRVSQRADQTFIFCDSGSSLELNPLDVSLPLPEYNVPLRKAKELTITDKIVDIEGRVVKEPEMLLPATETMAEMYEFIIEDDDGDPISISYRGDISLYTDTSIHLGDYIKIYGAFVDVSSLLFPMKIPVVRLRAYSRIKKKM